LHVTAAETFAAGDHLNDLPMLSRQYAHWLAAPANAIDIVKATVRQQGGHVSELMCGHGVAEGLHYHGNRFFAVFGGIPDAPEGHCENSPAFPTPGTRPMPKARLIPSYERCLWESGSAVPAGLL
jgi:hypothetical protein